ncbi:MAG: NAD-dependent epimerase/dehydratase family protein [Bacteroidia bacterium]|nr:NAD-dependent epimerase/dehydratase family protein [Bacteroidia bacterium]
MKVIITGSTGMVGKGVLLVCLDDPRVDQVLVVNRSPVGITHPKLKEVLHSDFIDLDAIKEELKGYDATYFCLGVSAGGMSENDYKTITYNYATTFAKAVLTENPISTFIYISGTGTDSSEKGRLMWARVKGATENAILKMSFKHAYMFRPGLIEPKRGIQSRTKLYRVLLKIINPLWPVLRPLLSSSLTDTDRIGKAMINVTINGSEKTHFENREINQLADIE